MNQKKGGEEKATSKHPHRYNIGTTDEPERHGKLKNKGEGQKKTDAKVGTRKLKQRRLKSRE